MAHTPYCAMNMTETWMDVLNDNPADPEDVLNQRDTISIEELRDHELTAQELAGIDDLTPTDTFMKINGDTAYVTR
jgi:hypothetical protein